MNKIFQIIILVTPLLIGAETFKSGTCIYDFKSNKKLAILTKDYFFKVDIDSIGNFYVDDILFLNKKLSSETDTLIKAGSDIYNDQNEVIGKIQFDYETMTYRIGKTSGIFFRGRIKRIDIDSNIILEKQLAAILNNDKNLSSYAAFLKTNRFEEFEPRNGFKMYYNTVAEILGSPTIRVALTFYNDKIFSIISLYGLPKSIYGSSESFAGQSRYPIYYLTKNKKDIQLFKNTFEQYMGNAD